MSKELESYEHTQLDLSGVWDAEDRWLCLWFSVERDRLTTRERRRRPSHIERASKLTSHLSRIVTRTSIEPLHFWEHTTAGEDHSPLIQPSELYLEEPCRDIMLIEAHQPRPNYESDALQECGFVIADVYGDVMGERVEQ